MHGMFVERRLLGLGGRTTENMFLVETDSGSQSFDLAVFDKNGNRYSLVKETASSPLGGVPINGILPIAVDPQKPLGSDIFIEGSVSGATRFMRSGYATETNFSAGVPGVVPKSTQLDLLNLNLIGNDGYASGHCCNGQGSAIVSNGSVVLILNVYQHLIRADASGIVTQAFTQVNGTPGVINSFLGVNVLWNGSNFILLCTNGEIFTSGDGLTWTYLRSVAAPANWVTGLSMVDNGAETKIYSSAEAFVLVIGGELDTHEVLGIMGVENVTYREVPTELYIRTTYTQNPANSTYSGEVFSSLDGITWTPAGTTMSPSTGNIPFPTYATSSWLVTPTVYVDRYAVGLIGGSAISYDAIIPQYVPNKSVWVKVANPSIEGDYIAAGGGLATRNPMYNGYAIQISTIGNGVLYNEDQGVLYTFRLPNPADSILGYFWFGNTLLVGRLTTSGSVLIEQYLIDLGTTPLLVYGQLAEIAPMVDGDGVKIPYYIRIK